MSKGPKPITFAEVAALAQEAEEFIESQDKIRNYHDLKPVIDQFISNEKPCRACFNFLLGKGILRKDQEPSFRQAYYAMKKLQSEGE